MNTHKLIKSVTKLRHSDASKKAGFSEIGNPLPLTPFKRMLYIVLGSLSLGLALLGVFVPGLPVTPLALLAGWFYARSSERLYNKLLSNKYLGKKIRNYREKGGLTKPKKRMIILFMSCMVLFSSFVVVPSGFVRYMILTLGVIGGVVVWSVVPTVQVD